MDDLSWVKVSIGLFDNKKIKHIRTLPDGDKIALFWVMLITLAGHCNCGGKVFFLEDIPYTPKTLAKEATMEENVIQLALDSFKLLKMIEIDEDGFIYILNWAEYQSEDKLSELREYNRLAKQRSRARQKELALADVNDMSMTSQHKEEESELDKKSHSFNQRACAQESNKYNIDAEGGRYMLPVGVILSPEQLDDLADKLTREEFDKYTKVVADAEKRGKHYTRKTHYQAILDMAIADRKVFKRG